MKNKSKLNKIKQNKQGDSRIPREWLYLNPKQITVRDIAKVFPVSQNDGMKVQLWEDAGIVEVELPEAKSIDMEWTNADLGDEYSNEYLAKNQIQTVFLVTLVPEDYAKAELAMKKIVNTLGGFFCGDTEDFSPVVK